MKQVLHIIAKDVRHLRIEILIALAMVAAQCWFGRAQWAIQGPQYGATPTDIMKLVSSLLLPLMLIVWTLLIARAVHAEPLVGDRQFWITRPYAWEKLLAAKLIFFALFIYLPFFLLQCILLAEAGFSPLHWTPRILMSLVLMSASVILPLIAIASVTTSFGGVALALVGVLFYFLILLAASALQGHLIQTRGLPGPAPVGGYLTALILFLACTLAVILQYGARRALFSRLLLIGAVAVSCAARFTDPDRLLMNRTYPRTDTQVAVSLRDLPGANGPGQARVWAGTSQVRTWAGGSEYRIGIPLRFTGIAEGGTAISVDAVNATFEMGNGIRWSSGWQPQTDFIHFAQGRDVAVFITMPDKVYSKLKDGTAGVRLTLATTEMKAGTSTEVQLPQPMQEFSVTGVGICKPQAGFSGDAQSLTCRFPFQAPLTYVSAQWLDRPCSQSEGDPGVKGSGWVGSLRSSAPGTDFFPVQYPAFPLSNGMQQTPNGLQPRNLCPGTPVTFTPYELMRRIQTTINIQNFHL